MGYYIFAFFCILLNNNLVFSFHTNFSKKNHYKNNCIDMNMNIKNFKNDELPLFTKVEPKDILSNTNQLLEKLKKDFKSLEEEMETEKKNYYDLAIYKKEKIEEPLEFYWGLISHLTSVKNNKELREAHEKAMPEVIKVSNDISQSKILYDCLIKSSKQRLNPIKKRILKKEIEAMKLNGVNLDNDKKKEFLEISLRLSDLVINSEIMF